MSLFNIFKKKPEQTVTNPTVETNEPNKSVEINSTAETVEIEKTVETVEPGKPEPTVETGKPETTDNCETGARNVYNLIILDESGSMMSIYHPALTGLNETLQTIRAAQQEHADQNHYVSLVLFDTSHYNRVYDGIEAAKAVDLTKDQYRPGGGTPLYDAMGRSLTELSRRVKKGDVVLVTIITDGYENASREYNGASIQKLVEQLKEEGWVFTYIGANQDVEKVAGDMKIDNYMSFNADCESTRLMFEKERCARRRFFSKIQNTDIDLNDLQSDYFSEDPDDDNPDDDTTPNTNNTNKPNNA